MLWRKNFPDESRTTIRAVKATTELSLGEIAQCCKISKTRVHHIIWAQDRTFDPWTRPLIPEEEALILWSIEELRDQEGSFCSRHLVELMGIRHVTDQTVRLLPNRSEYFFLQACKNGLMSQTDKDSREAFAWWLHTDSLPYYLNHVSFVNRRNV